MARDRAPDRPTWLTSGRLMARYLGQPVTRFLEIEASGGILLMLATVVALGWANSPWSASYHQVWSTEALLHVGPVRMAEDLRHWVSDGLMTLFFFVVGLEIKRELVDGQLRRLRDATLPGLAALGGMVVPAAIFLVVTTGTSSSAGWGIPMATDIAFALAVLTVLGDRIPASLKVLLLGLAIADDIGAILVIAVVYSEHVSWQWLLAAGAGLLLVVLMRRAQVWSTPAYVAIGIAVWACTFESGIHATIAGVVLGLLTPAHPLLPALEADAVADRLSADTNVTADEVHAIGFELRESVSVAERLESLLHPWTSYVVLPVFALANAGIPLSSTALGDAAGSRTTIGVVLGLVVGKLVGISAFAWLAVRARLARLPDDLGWPQVVGMAAIAGIGFTVSIFVSGLAYTDDAVRDEAKIGVLVASVLAAGLGSLLLVRSTSRAPSTVPERNRDFEV